MRAGEAIEIEYEYKRDKPAQTLRVTKMRPAGKWLHMTRPGRGTIEVKPDVFGLGVPREWSYLW